MKTPSGSLFAKLTPDQREELLRLLDEDCISVAQAVERCADWGVKTSAGSVSRFYATHGFAWRLDRARKAAEASVSGSPVDLEAETRRVIGQKVFEIVARRDADPDAVLNAHALQLKERDLKLKEEGLKLAERRVKVLEGKMADAKAKLEAVKSKGGLSASTLAEIEEAAKLL